MIDTNDSPKKPIGVKSLFTHQKNLLPRKPGLQGSFFLNEIGLQESQSIALMGKYLLTVAIALVAMALAVKCSREQLEADEDTKTSEHEPVSRRSPQLTGVCGMHSWKRCRRRSATVRR